MKKAIRGLGTLLTRGGTWHVEFTVNGERYRESTHKKKYNEALNFLKTRISEIQTGSFAGPTRERISMDELLTDVLNDYKTYHPKSVRFAEPVINLHLKPWFAQQRAVSVSTSSIRAYIKARKDAGAADATVNKELSLLRRSFKLGQTQTPSKVLNLPNFKGLFFVENNARQGFLEHEQYLIFRDALPEDERAAFVFGYYTLCRATEVLMLRWIDIDFERSVALLHQGETKNNEPRIIPLGGPASELSHLLASRKALRDELCPKSPWVFFRSVNRGNRGKSTRQIGNPLRNIRKVWNAAVASTGVDPLFHDLRRTGARNMRKAGASEGVIMAVGGWKTSSVFRRYDIKDEADLHEATDKMNTFLASKVSSI